VREKEEKKKKQSYKHGVIGWRGRSSKSDKEYKSVKDVTADNQRRQSAAEQQK
jgi:hypothetical protein